MVSTTLHLVSRQYHSARRNHVSTTSPCSTTTTSVSCTTSVHELFEGYSSRVVARLVHVRFLKRLDMASPLDDKWLVDISGEVGQGQPSVWKLANEAGSVLCWKLDRPSFHTTSYPSRQQHFSPHWSSPFINCPGLSSPNPIFLYMTSPGDLPYQINKHPLSYQHIPSC